MSTSLEDRLDSFPEGWKPQAGDKITGEVTDVTTRESEYGDPYQIVTVLTDEGQEWAFHAFHTMARRELEKQKPQVGDWIGIKYHGLGVSAKPGQSAPHRYRIIVDHRAPANPTQQEAGLLAEAAEFGTVSDATGAAVSPSGPKPNAQGALQDTGDDIPF